jgi:hypothetical protein
MKKKLTQQQEFEVLKLVLDKFLWLGFGIMAFGLFIILRTIESFYQGLSLMIVGAIILILFMLLLIKEYEIVK